MISRIRPYFYCFTFIFFGILICNVSYGQRGQSKLRIKGSISAGMFHLSSGNIGALPALGANMNLNATLSYRQFSIPVSASLNNRGTQFSNPFHRYGISPRYKWVKFHLGWRQIQFSKYTLAGTPFFGIGIEVDPGILRFSAMHGKLDRRIRNLNSQQQKVLPIRKISAVKLGIGSYRNHFDFIFMQASDGIGDIDTLNFEPKENITLGNKFKCSLLKNKVSLYYDAAVSIFTENRERPANLLEEVSFPRAFNNLLTPNNSTHINYAINGGINFHFGPVQIQNSYRRIMPEYKSLGINYLRNDLEAYLFAPSIAFFDRKLNISGSYGLESNNLDGLRNQDQKRVISSLNVSLNLQNKHNINMQYSNYNFDQQIRFDSLMTDTISLQQVNSNIGGNYNYTAVTERYIQTISLIINTQDASVIGSPENTNTTFTSMLNYSYANIKGGSSINGGVSYFKIDVGESMTQQIGLNVGYSFKTDRQNIYLRMGAVKGIDDAFQNLYGGIRYSYKITDLMSINANINARTSKIQNRADRNQIRSDMGVKLKF
ncbi:MAG: hypothetical protein ACJA1A_000700 [Saprospiraceae bacterium]|jgi:hypothetical protein